MPESLTRLFPIMTPHMQGPASAPPFTSRRARHHHSHHHSHPPASLCDFNLDQKRAAASTRVVETVPTIAFARTNTRHDSREACGCTQQATIQHARLSVSKTFPVEARCWSLFLLDRAYKVTFNSR